MAVEASVVVVFGDTVTDSQSVSVEIDDQHENNLDHEGNVKSSFSPTDTPVFLIHHDDDVRVTGVKCTDGSVARLNTSPISRVRTVTNQLFPLVTSKAQLSYFGVNSLSVEWWGNSAVLGITNSKILPTSGTFPCHGDMTFSVRFNEQWRLTPPYLSLEEDETYTIQVVVYMEDIEND